MILLILIPFFFCCILLQLLHIIEIRIYTTLSLFTVLVKTLDKPTKNISLYMKIGSDIKIKNREHNNRSVGTQKSPGVYLDRHRNNGLRLIIWREKLVRTPETLRTPLSLQSWMDLLVRFYTSRTWVSSQTLGIVKSVNSISMRVN